MICYKEVWGRRILLINQQGRRPLIFVTWEAFPESGKVFGTERHFQKNIVPRKRSKTACFVRDAAWAAWNSVQKLNFSTLSSLKKQI